jgi:hypothetical protein
LATRPLADRIGDGRHDDRDRAGRALGRSGAYRGNRYDHIDLEPHQFCSHCRQAFFLACRPAIFQQEVASFGVTQAAQPLAEGFGIRVRTGLDREKADAPDLALLLREGNERRRAKRRKNKYGVTSIHPTPVGCYL